MELKVDLVYNNHALGVEVSMTPVIPAITRGNPEDRAPAEGGEIEIRDIYMHRTTRAGAEVSRRLPRSVVEAYNADEDFIDAVRIAVAEIGR